MPDTDFSLESARTAARGDDLNTWVAQFLRSPGSDNAALAEELTSPPRAWRGPMQLPIDQLHRLAGPPDEPTLGRFDGDDLDTVESMDDSIDDGWEPPPVIVSVRGDQLVVEDGNHRIEGLRRNGRTECWALLGAGGAADIDRVEQRLSGPGG